MSLQNNMPPMSSAFNQHPPPSQQQGTLQDAETVRRNYHTALSELTFNSKPIITSLTITAQENQHAANVIVREIEQQIRHNAPGQKLPVLYLIDSICKNVGGVYIDHFARNIGNTFMDAYTLTEPQTRRSFERLLQTWKNGMPNGQPVFSRHVIEPIERAVNFMRERQQQQQHQHHQQQPPHPPLPPPPQQQQHHPLQHHPQSSSHPSPRYAQSPAQPSPRNQQIHVNPNFVPRGTGTGTNTSSGSRDPRNRLEYATPPVQDRNLQHHHHQQQQQQQRPTPPRQPSPSQVKKQKKRRRMPPRIEQRPNAQMPPTVEPVRKEGSEQLSQLFSQLQAILPGLPPTQAATVQQQLDQIMHPATPAAAAAAGVPLPTSAPPMAGNPVRLAYPPSSSMPPQLPMTAISVATSTPISQPVPQTATPPPALNALELVQSLASLGYLKSGTNATAPAAITTTPITRGGDGLKAPGGSMTQSPIRLDSKDLQIARPGAVEVLYSGLPLQCKQCGFRYPKTPEGQSKMDAHLDSHFRQNRRMKERVKRSLSRSWFVTEDEWVSGAGGELTSHQAPAFLTDTTHGQFGHGAGSPSAAGAADTVSPESHLVVMPDENNRKPCPICGERFVDFWNDDEEEWMYKNAVLVNNTIYHATCHADAVKSGTLVSNDEDVDMANESSQTLAAAAGMKRKVEELDQSIMTEIKMARTDATDEQK